MQSPAKSKGWQETYEAPAKLLKSSTHPQGPKHQGRRIRSACAKGVAENLVQIPNPYPGEVRRRCVGTHDLSVGQSRAAIRRAKTLRANPFRGRRARIGLEGAVPSSILCGNAPKYFLIAY